MELTQVIREIFFHRSEFFFSIIKIRVEIYKFWKHVQHFFEYFELSY